MATCVATRAAAAMAALPRQLCTAATELPLVALVGAPNVGKSTLFNRFVGKARVKRGAVWPGPRQLAIVSPLPGTTRDCLAARTEWEGAAFVVVDTAGLYYAPPPGSAARDAPAPEVVAAAEAQAERAIADAAAIVVVGDAHRGVTPADEEVADRLRRLSTPVVLAVNKVDSPETEHLLAEWWGLGLGEPLPVSAVHGQGTGALLSAVTLALAPAPTPAAPEESFRDAATGREAGATAVPESAHDPRPLVRPLHLAIVGRPNVGKSSFLNRLTGHATAIVSDVAGTTRDAIASELVWKGRRVVLVDTAGLRRKRSERFGGAGPGTRAARKAARAVGMGTSPQGAAHPDVAAQRATLREVSAATVSLVLFDAAEGFQQHDAAVLSECVSERRTCVLVANKWDLATAQGLDWGAMHRRIRDAVPSLHFVPVLPMAATTGEGVGKVMDKAMSVADARSARVPTSELNDAVMHAVHRSPPPRGTSVRFAVQADAEVPTFVVFTRGHKLQQSYLRYLEHTVRSQSGFLGTPIRLVCKGTDSDRARRQRCGEGTEGAPGRQGRRSYPQLAETCR